MVAGGKTNLLDDGDDVGKMNLHEDDDVGKMNLHDEDVDGKGELKQNEWADEHSLLHSRMYYYCLMYCLILHFHHHHSHCVGLVCRHSQKRDLILEKGGIWPKMYPLQPHLDWNPRMMG